jgi:AcrR family transcriptional regulator
MPAASSPPTTRQRLLDAASQLLANGGRAAVSTRVVSAAAGVQPQTLYRLFGDMDGLLEAVASSAFDRYLRDKELLDDSADPVETLRRSWDLHVGFGLSQPAFYLLIYGGGGKATLAREHAEQMLRQMLTRVAAEGLLRMSVERAATLMHAQAVGMVLTLLGRPESERDLGALGVARDAVLGLIMNDAPVSPGTAAEVARQAVTLQATLRGRETSALSDAERGLLDEWLGRIADKT